MIEKLWDRDSWSARQVFEEAVGGSEKGKSKFLNVLEVEVS